MIGPKKCPEWLKKAYKKAVDYTCEQCRKKFTESQLEIHRIITGDMGGTYKPSNCKVVCKGCHSFYTEAHRMASNR